MAPRGASARHARIGPAVGPGERANALGAPPRSCSSPRSGLDRLFLLDTNIVSDLVRHPGGAVADAVARAGETGVRMSVVVAAELRYVAAKKGSARLSQQLETVL